MESRVSHEESAARPFTLSAEHVAVLRGKVEDEESVVYEHEWYELFDSHEALRSLLSDREETIKALRAELASLEGAYEELVNRESM